MKFSTSSSILFLLVAAGSTNMQASWLYVDHYPWVYSNVDGWLYCYPESIPAYRYFDGERMALGEERPGLPSSLKGLNWSLDFTYKGEPFSSSLRYAESYDGYEGPVLVTNQPFLTPMYQDFGGAPALYSVDTYELADGRLLLTSVALGSGKVSVIFDFETVTSGTFETFIEYPRPAFGYRGTFTVAPLIE